MKEGLRFTIMKIFSFIKDKGAIIAGTIKRCPVKSSFLILCILLLAGFEMWGHFSPLPAHDWNPIKLKWIWPDAFLLHATLGYPPDAVGCLCGF